MSRDSTDLNWAVTEVRGVAECFKTVGGEPEKTILLTGGEVTVGTLSLEYDEC